MKKYTVDRIEDGQIAVLLLREDETQQVDISLEQLPIEIKEGDLISADISDKGKVNHAEVLQQQTFDARKKAESLLDKLKNKK